MRRTRIRTNATPKVRLNKDGKPRERFEGLRDEAKREWIRHQPCAVANEGCQYERTTEGFFSDAEHVENKARGLGDDSLIPLCRRHHRERHDFGPKDFQRTYKVNTTLLAGEYQLRWERENGAPVL